MLIVPLKPRLFILSFSPLPVDGRVLRQIKALAPHFDVTAAGLDDDPSAQLPGVPFRFVPLHRRRGFAGKVLRMSSYLAGAVFPPGDFWPWSLTSEYCMARAALFAEDYDVMLCNDLNAVLLGVEAWRRKRLPFVADYHEFPAGEATERLSHRWLKGPHGHRCLRRYGPLAAGTLTVNRSFARVFQERYGFPAEVVLNAPELQPLPPPRAEDGILRLVYHGIGGANRNLELMIEAVGQLRRPAALHLMLLPDAGYEQHLRQVAEKAAPGRVVFETPVPPAQIAAKVSRFDVGLFVVQAHSFNNEQALPNKLFEYVHGGLAVCCSASPALTEFITEHGNGWLMKDTTSAALAQILESITPEELAAKKQASLRVREEIHAGTETARMVALLKDVVARHSRSTAA
jgi:glycosyltransferase involved in cell wall biosynthesis